MKEISYEIIFINTLLKCLNIRTISFFLTKLNKILSK